MEAVVVQFKIPYLYLHRKRRKTSKTLSEDNASWPRFEPGTSRMQLTLFLRNLISNHRFKTESSMILLPNNFLISCLEFLNYLLVTTFKIHRDGALNLDFDTKGYSPSRILFGQPWNVRGRHTAADTNIQQRIGEIFQLAARQQWKIRNRGKQRKREYCDVMKTDIEQ